MLSRNGGIVLSVSGLVALQGAGLVYFGLAFWPAVLVTSGGVLAWAGLNKQPKTGTSPASSADPGVAASSEYAGLLKAKARAEVEVIAIRLM